MKIFSGISIYVLDWTLQVHCTFLLFNIGLRSFNRDLDNNFFALNQYILKTYSP